MLQINELYPHLTKKQIDDSIEFDKNYKFNLVDDTDRDILQRINSVVNSLMPIMKNGNRMTDIEALQSATGVSRDILLNSLVPRTDNSSSDFVLPRNASKSDVLSYLSILKNDIDIANASSDLSEPIDEPDSNNETNSNTNPQTE